MSARRTAWTWSNARTPPCRHPGSTSSACSSTSWGRPMASSDYRQVTTIVRRLGDLLNPAGPVTAIAEVIAAVSVPPPGDPDALEALAAAYRAAAEAIRRLPIPQRAPRPFTDVADALAELAAAVREQCRRHVELRQRLEAATRDATHVGALPMLDPTALDDVARVVTELVEVYT